MKRMRTGIACLLTAMLFSAGTVNAENLAVKSYTLIVENGAGEIVAEPATAGFWEYPMLSGGESRTDGMLRLFNGSPTPIDMHLTAIDLPYDSREALLYLGALRIRVTAEDTVLYDGPYSHIADAAGGLKLSASALQPGNGKDFRISLYSSFSYTGTPIEVSRQINWHFAAVPAAVEATPQVQPPPPLGALFLVIGAGLLVILCAVLGACRITKKRKQ